MPLFRHFESDNSTHYAFVPYKGLYSLFASSGQWQFINDYATPRLLLYALIRERRLKSWLITRDPFDRLVSCFKDKFRKQPMRIAEAGFHWQKCHDIIFERIGMPKSADDERKAKSLADFSFDQFIRMLPTIYTLDGHFQPQMWLAQLEFGFFRCGRWPDLQPIRMESIEQLRKVPGLDLDIKKNSTRNVEMDFEWTADNRRIVRGLYRDDFVLGGY